MSERTDEELARLARELEQAKSHDTVGSTARLYVTAVIALAAITIFGVILTAVLVPAESRNAAQTLIIGITGPIIAGLLAAALARIAHAMNSRLDNLLDATASLWLARGRAEVRKEGDGDDD